MREEGKTIGEWHRMNSPRYPMRDEGDMIAAGPRVYTPFGCAWRIALAVVIVYVLLTAALVLIPHA